jgi:hypothetical protein
MSHQPHSHQRRIIDSRHPNFLVDHGEWEKWRLTYRGGRRYIDKFLEKIDRQEDNRDFESRKKITPLPTFAKAALNDVRNSIFQRMRDIVRRDGSDVYHRALAGLDNGVDFRGSTMNAFMGNDVLTELLVMGRVGIYVDSPTISREDGETPSLADVQSTGFRPYLYLYQAEDILSWRCSKPEDQSEFQAVLLRDTCLDFDQDTLLPLQAFERFRLLWIDAEDGLVRLQFLDGDGNSITADGFPTTEPIRLNLNRIPFVMPSIGDSLLRDVCQHQLALLNLTSRDVAYAMKANFPFYIEQRDLRAVGDHLKHNVNPDGTAEAGGQGNHLKEIQVGVTQGRSYDLRADAPSFINPSSEPLKASMDLQDKLETQIRQLVNLAVTNLASTRQSAESKSFDNQGLEAGLSFIGLVLESAERRVADFWASYESSDSRARQIATIKYPDRYSLKTDSERIGEAKELTDLIQQTPSSTARKELWKSIITILLGGRVSVDSMNEIFEQIDSAGFTTSDPETIIRAVEAGLSGEATASLALGFEPGEVDKARVDHAARIARIQEAQSAERGSENDGDGGDDSNPGARGVTDLDPDKGGDAANKERGQANDPDQQSDRRRRRRGRGKRNSGDQ